jgi:FkbM family methyltransferase
MSAISQKLNKPEYWFRPRQIFRKFQYTLTRNTLGDRVKVRLPWGTAISIYSHTTLGKELLTLGVHELAVSEVLWRLTDPGEICCDVGANMGYMTSLLARKAGATGKCFSFEPHPELFKRLKGNFENQRQNDAPVLMFPYALGDADTEMDLVEPENFANKMGMASLVADDSKSENMVKHRVKVHRLDGFFDKAESFGVVKIDVEGFETKVLRGAEGLLKQKRIRDIVFEDFNPFPSESVMILQRHGYRIFRMAKAIRGPLVWDPLLPGKHRSLPWEPVNYLATLDADRALERLRHKGWHCLRG